MKRKLVISTGNKNKVEEIRDILKDIEIEVLAKGDLGLGPIEVVEDGDTLASNSLKKARALGEKTDYMVIADDSGLFVDYLNGDPGVHSSRYAGKDGDDQANNEKLLRELKGVAMEDRGASFKTVIALIDEDKKESLLFGQCKGKIGFEEKGKGGFGYDPLFIPESYEETFSEMGEEEKNKISHRAKALKELKKEISKLIGVED